MRPPIPAEQRDTSGLNEVDAQLMTGDGARCMPLAATLAELNLSVPARRSQRLLSPTSLERALEVVAPLVTANSEWVAADGYIERHTFAPSAGARHPLTALILTKEKGQTRHRAWAVSPSVSPMLYEVRRHEPDIARTMSAVSAALHTTREPSTVVVALARFRRTLSKYPDGQSLIWRDSGVFLGYAHLVAASLGLHSCIVGVAETAEFALEGTSEALVDVGAIVLSEPEQGEAR